MKTIDIEDTFGPLPNDEYWKLIIDQEYWDSNDPLIFDKDESSGYLKSGSTALFFLLKTIAHPLTADYIIKLHDIAYHEKKIEKLGFSPSASSGLTDESVTIDGLRELLQKLKQRADNTLKLSYFTKGNDINKRHLIDIETTTAEEIFSNLDSREWPCLYIERYSDLKSTRDEVNKLLEKYQYSLKKASSEKEIMIAIATLIRELHQYHPFKDGNGRTFIFLLLNKLLIMNELSPTTVPSPGRFSGYSILELVDEITEGQHTFRDICTQIDEKDMSLQDYIQSKYPLPFPSPTNLSFFNEETKDGENSQTTSLIPPVA